MTGEGRGSTLPSPGLGWERGHTPTAERFGDVYYSRDGGLAQSRHVFLGGNDLPDAWRNKARACIGELGFGTGLNFLATWDAWRRTRPPGARLHYIAVEGFPLTAAELGECLRPWEDLRDLSRALLGAYPEPQRGFHRAFPATGPSDLGEVSLTLLYGDARAMLSQLEAKIDAWFLDGFAPDKNPDMWSAGVFAEVARLSHPGTTVATYSVAGDVRRGLNAAGFDVARAPGFAGKREMLRAKFRGDNGRTDSLPPWFAPAPHAATPGHAVILGAGLAGTHAAAALNRRGWRTTIIERAGGIAAEASGTPRAVMAPRLTVGAARDGLFYAAAWRFALAALDSGDGERARTGSLQLSRGDDVQRLASITEAGTLPPAFLTKVTADEASDIAGLRVTKGGLFFPQGGWVQPRTLCTALSAASDVRFDVEASTLTSIGGRWRVGNVAGNVLADADIVILGNALGAARFAESAWLPLEARRGQITLMPTNAQASMLRSVLLYGGFLTPSHHGLHALGATFDPVMPGDDTGVRSADHARNFADLETIAPGLFQPTQDVGGFAAVRCMSPDHLPIVGPLPDRAGFVADFAALRHGHPASRYPEARYHHGLYALTALGARGVVSAPLAAEVLACHITGEPWPIERDLVTALHPARFLVRDLKRREI